MEKVLMEQQLQETAGELVAAERELAAGRSTAPASLHSYDSSASSHLYAPDTPSQLRSGAGAADDPANDFAADVDMLRSENNAIMQARDCFV